jgi:uncharacterized phosphatase
MPKTIYFVRHAESEANAAGLMAGSGYDVPLSEVGKIQAQKAGVDLKGKGIELVIASPMIRTMQTATIIANEIGYDIEDITTDERFVERGYGPYEAQSFEQYSHDAETNSLKPGIEALEDLQKRVEQGLASVRNLEATKILLVSHGTTGRMVKVIAQKLPHGHFHTIDGIGNAEVFEFTLD